MGTIRIISGEARGRILYTFNNDLSVRPLLSRIKKSLFDIIKNKIVNSDFLDLYAGTGSVGIEAISRGAKQVTFIDSDLKCVNLIKKNISLLNWSKDSNVYQSDILKGLGWLGKRFDIVYLGPPYKDNNEKPLFLTTTTLNIIVKSDLLKNNSLIISQHHIKEPVSDIKGIKNCRREKYGDTILDFFVKDE